MQSHLIQIARTCAIFAASSKGRLACRNRRSTAAARAPSGHLVFNNPAKLNAVSLDMWDAFVGILKDYEKDPEVRCVVVSGAGGKAFVSGADISKFESERANAEAQVRYDAISKARLRRRSTIFPSRPSPRSPATASAAA